VIKPTLYNTITRPNISDGNMSLFWMRLSKEFSNRPQHIRKGQFVVNLVRDFDPNYICPVLFHCKDKEFPGKFVQFLEVMQWTRKASNSG